MATADRQQNPQMAVVWLLEELGIVSMYQSKRDIKILCLQRLVRLFAFGASTLVLIPFLVEQHLSQAQVGIFMSLTLIGSVGVSFMLTLSADRLGRRSVIILGAVSMAASGLTFAMSSNYYLLLGAAIIGFISPRLIALFRSCPSLDSNRKLTPKVVETKLAPFELSRKALLHI
jgi:hypothetical protein